MYLKFKHVLIPTQLYLALIGLMLKKFRQATPKTISKTKQLLNHTLLMLRSLLVVACKFIQKFCFVLDICRCCDLQKLMADTGLLGGNRWSRRKVSP